MDGVGWVGQVGRGLDSEQAWNYAWSVGLLFVAAVVGGIFILVASKWRKKGGGPSTTAGDQLTHFRELYERGMLSKGEYERVRGQLAGDLRRELNVDSPNVPMEIRPEDTLTDPPPPGPDVPPDGIKPAG